MNASTDADIDPEPEPLGLLYQRMLAAVIALAGVTLALIAVMVADHHLPDLLVAGLGFAAIYMTVTAAIVNTRRE